MKNPLTSHRCSDHRHHGDADAGPTRIGRETATAAAAVAAAARLAAEQTIQALIEIAPELIEIRRPIAGLLAILRLMRRFILRSPAPTRIVNAERDADFF